MKIIVRDRTLVLDEIIVSSDTIDGIRQYLETNSIEYLDNDHYDEDLEELASTIVDRILVPYAQTTNPNLKHLVTWHDSVQFFDFLNAVLQNQCLDHYTVDLVFDIEITDDVVVKYLEHLNQMLNFIEFSRPVFELGIDHKDFAKNSALMIKISNTDIKNTTLLNFYTDLILNFYALLGKVYNEDALDKSSINAYQQQIQSALHLTAKINNQILKDLLFAGGLPSLLISQMSSVIQFIEKILSILPQKPQNDLMAYIKSLKGQPS